MAMEKVKSGDDVMDLFGRQVQAEARALERRSQDLLKRAEKLAVRLKALEEKGAGPKQS
jgi:hypothetical protein